MADARLKIAVFIDFDNIEIGVKTTLNRPFDVGTVLEAIKERGEVVTKFAYGDWQRAGDHSRQLTQHAIHMVQRNLTPGGDKNGADINLALDALEMAFTHNHINAFVIVSGDSDFIALVEKLKQYDKKVFVVGGRAFTSIILQKNCNEFIAYENLLGSQGPSRRVVERGRTAVAGPTNDGHLTQVFPLVKRALQVLSEREVSPQLGLLKSTLLQLDSTFSEREYGAGTFRDFVQKLAKAGLVNLKGTDRSVHVELRDPDAAQPAREWREGDTQAPPAQIVAVPHPTPAPTAPPDAGDREEAPEAAASDQEPGTPPPPATGLQPADGMEAIRHIFRTSATPPRWPMYVRNVKQFLKTTDETFDERRFGFQGILDALRLGQREGIFRLERDRRGILRVFPGQQLQVPTASAGAIDVTPAADFVSVPDGPQEPQDDQIAMFGPARRPRPQQVERVPARGRSASEGGAPDLDDTQEDTPAEGVAGDVTADAATDIAADAAEPAQPPAETPSTAASPRRARAAGRPVSRKKTGGATPRKAAASRARKPKAV